MSFHPAPHVEQTTKIQIDMVRFGTCRQQALLALIVFYLKETFKFLLGRFLGVTLRDFNSFRFVEITCKSINFYSVNLSLSALIVLSFDLC